MTFDKSFFVILGSPFRVHVRDRLDANRVNVKMSPGMRAGVLQEILIDGQAAGPGNPSVDITDIHGKFFKVILHTKAKKTIIDSERRDKNMVRYIYLYSKGKKRAITQRNERRTVPT